MKGAAAGAWQTRLYVDGTAAGGAQAMQFSDTGQLTTPASGQIAFDDHFADAARTAGHKSRFAGEDPFGATHELDRVSNLCTLPSAPIWKPVML